MDMNLNLIKILLSLFLSFNTFADPNYFVHKKPIQNKEIYYIYYPYFISQDPNNQLNLKGYAPPPQMINGVPVFNTLIEKPKIKPQQTPVVSQQDEIPTPIIKPKQIFERRRSQQIVERTEINADPEVKINRELDTKRIVDQSDEEDSVNYIIFN